MPQDISAQILSQASDNIQKLFDLSTRIDERLKNLQERQNTIDHRIDELVSRQLSILQRLAVLDSKDMSTLSEKIDESADEMNEIDKRLMKIENDSGRSNDRWKGVAGFVIQLVWVILAAYLLTKFNLQAPAVP